MKTGSSGTFVISWSQTETDGLKAAQLDVVNVGAVWRWTGVPVRVDGPQNILLLDGAEGAADMRKRAARVVRRLIGVAVGTQAGLEDGQDDLPHHLLAMPLIGFVYRVWDCGFHKFYFSTNPHRR